MKRIAWMALAALLGCAAPTLEGTRTFAIQNQKIDLQELGDSRFDLVAIDVDGFSRAQIDSLKSRRKIVLGYLSIGEAEEYRTYWRKEWKEHPPAWLGPENPDWPGNFKVRYWDEQWQRIVLESLDAIVARGANGVYLDVIDAYEFWETREAGARARMIELVRAISRRAKASNPRFAVFAQNCEQLVEDDGYLAAIDGIGREETYFYQGQKNRDGRIRESERWLDRAVAAGKKVAVIEYLVDRESIDWFVARARSKGYLPYVATPALDCLGQPR